MAAALSDYVITEAGFGADLSAPGYQVPFLGIAPSACVWVGDGACPQDGGVAKASLPNPEAVRAGAANLVRHGRPEKRLWWWWPSMPSSRYPEERVEQVCVHGRSLRSERGVRKEARAGEALAQQAVSQILEDHPHPVHLPTGCPLKQKIEAVATKIYRADAGQLQHGSLQALAELTEMILPVVRPKPSTASATMPSSWQPPPALR